MLFEIKSMRFSAT